MAVASKGMLVEYGLSLPPLALIFDFNPQQISRSRSVTIRTGNAPGARLGYDFLTPLDAPRAAQGVELQGESISVTILLDATDKMLEGDAIAAQFGVQPQIDTLRSIQETASVLIFAWGLQFLPVFLTGVSQNETMHLPSLHPYRAEMTLNMQVIESNNPFFLAEKVRQTAMTALNAVAFVGRLG
jgi:hypothetical protein